MDLGVISRAGLRLIGRSLLVGVRRRVEVIRYDSGPRSRPPFQPPLRIAAVGDAARAVVEAIKRPSGLEVTFLRLPEHLQECPHILVTQATDLPRTMAVAFRGVRGAETPALIVSLGGNWELLRRLPGVPRGVAVLAVRFLRARSLLEAIIENIAQDLPLERAIKEGARKLEPFLSSLRSIIRRRRGILLIMDRALDDALRLGDAIEMLGIQRELAGSLLEKKEKEDLHNLWQIASALKQGTAESAGPRLLDMNLVRATYRPDVPRRLAAGTTLACGADYLLEVHVGARLATSMIRGEEENPSSSGGTSMPDVLDVALQDKELKVVSSHMRQLALPAAGPSRLLFFTLRTPEKTGSAGLRLMVYRRNQMLQSYLVEVEVAEQEVELQARDRGATAQLDFSDTRDLAPKPAETSMEGGVSPAIAPGPLLSIAVNRNGADTHAIFVKGAEDAVGFSIPESGVNSNLQAFREILLNASYTKEIDADGKPKPRLWTQKPGSFSKEFIKDLANFGTDAYHAYLDNTAERLRDTLQTIRTTDDKVIGIVRYDERFAFPWPVFYDMHLPRFAWNADVCFGESAPGVKCAHTGQSRAYCIRGFWGYRHRIQELIGNRKPEDRVDHVGRKKAPGSLQFLAGISDQYAKDIEQMIKGLEGSDKIQPTDSTALLDALWDNARRPAVLVVLGHLFHKAEEREPIGPRIPLPAAQAPTQDWLLSRDILEYLDDHPPWQDPNTVVVLLTCESAATTPETLTDFVIAFNRARAGAIIGTECLALSDCMARFSKAFFPLVWEGSMSLGEAMTKVRRTLLEQGYPLAFVFSCIGRADLKVDRR